MSAHILKKFKSMTIEEVFGSTTFDCDGTDYTITKFREIDQDLRSVLEGSYNNSLPPPAGDASSSGDSSSPRSTTPTSNPFKNLAPIAQKTNGEEYDNLVFIVSTAEDVDHIAYRPTSLDSAKVEFIFLNDVIMGDTVSPLQLIQYNYAKADGSLTPWLFCSTADYGITYYRQNKFKVWKEQMMSCFGNCIAAFYPEITRGYAMTNLFDSSCFPYHNGDGADNRRFTIEFGGKVVRVPRPLNAMRMWNHGVSPVEPTESSAASGGGSSSLLSSSESYYTPVTCVMDGAPPEETKTEFWKGFLDEMRKHFATHMFGPEFIDDCLTLPLEEVKKKYQ